MVFYGVVCSAGQQLCDLGPFIAELFLRLVYYTLIFGRPPGKTCMFLGNTFAVKYGCKNKQIREEDRRVKGCYSRSLVDAWIEMVQPAGAALLAGALTSVVESFL